MRDTSGTVCFATGMRAIAAVFFSLLKAGDHIVSSRHVFGNTNSLLGTLRQFGVAVSMVDMASSQAVADALTPATRMVFVETIANPGTQIADLQGIGLGDTRTLVIPVASTIFWEAGPAKRKEMDIPDGLIRVSVGLEEIEDLIEDFTRAFNAMS